MIMKYFPTNFPKSQSTDILAKTGSIEKRDLPPCSWDAPKKSTSVWDFREHHCEKEPSTCEGYLYVQNKSFFRLPTKQAWKRKYFTLKSDSLYMTECPNDTVQDSDCIKIGLDTGIYPRDHSDSDNPKFYIRITSGKQNYTLRSCEEDDRNTWITSLLMSMSTAIMGRTPPATPTTTAPTTPTTPAKINDVDD